MIQQDIAQDVIRLLDSKRLEASNVYLQCDWGKDEDDARKQLAGQTCFVCALGALFVAKIDRFNGISCGKASDLSGEWGMQEYLNDIFDRKQLQMIEGFYERWPHMIGYKYEDFLHNSIWARIPRDKRLRLICQDIMVDGKFNPERLINAVQSQNNEVPQV